MSSSSELCCCAPRTGEAAGLEAIGANRAVQQLGQWSRALHSLELGPEAVTRSVVQGIALQGRHSGRLFDEHDLIKENTALL